MRSFWITWMGPTSITSVIRERRAVTEAQREGQVKTGAETGGVWPQAKGSWSPRKLEEVKEGTPLRTSSGNTAL